MPTQGIDAGDAIVGIFSAPSYPTGKITIDFIHTLIIKDALFILAGIEADHRDMDVCTVKNPFTITDGEEYSATVNRASARCSAAFARALSMPVVANRCSARSFARPARA